MRKLAEADPQLRRLAVGRTELQSEQPLHEIARFFPRLGGVDEVRIARLALTEDGAVAHKRYQEMSGMEVAAVTSIVLTNKAATQVDTVRNSSEVIACFLSSGVHSP